MIFEEEGQKPQWLTQLNRFQQEAVEYSGGPLLVLAGAGSGKTRVITYRIAHLVQIRRASPWNILAVTFTNKAAQQMKERVFSLLGEQAQSVSVSTFHSFCARLLRREPLAAGIVPEFTIYDENDSQNVVKAALKRLQIGEENSLKPKAIKGHISRAKCELLGPEEMAETFNSQNLNLQNLPEIYAEYEKILRENGAVDFDDLLLLSINALKGTPEVLEKYRRRFKHVLIDEYQDTNRAQYVLMRLLAPPEENPDLCVVGDDDQSIYRWRGAQLNNILDFEKDYKGTKLIRLEENYRSTQTILDAANSVVSNNTKRKGKKLWTSNEKGQPLSLFAAADEKEEARQLANLIYMERQKKNTGTGIAVFYRTNAQSRTIEEALTQNRIPYQVIGGMRFYERQEVKDILAYLRVVVNPADNEAFKRAISNPKRGVGSITLEKLQLWTHERGQSMLEAVQAISPEDAVRSAQRITLVKFANMVSKWREVLEKGLDISSLLDRIIIESGYRAALMADKTQEARLENIDALLEGAQDYELNIYHTGTDENSESPQSLEVARHYLEHLSLMSSPDAMSNEDDRVTLMTLHCAKGLEFPLVFLTGMEEGVLPHGRSLDKPASLEEERRLCYVGMTRAMEKLTITMAWDRMQRYRQGPRTATVASRFLLEIPDKYFDEKGRQEFKRIKDAASMNPFRFDERNDFPQKQSYGSRDSSARYSQNKPASPRHQPRPARRHTGSHQPAVDLSSGDRVMHPTFGLGVVDSIDGSGDQLVATVNFSKGGKKLLMPKYAKMRKLK